MLKYNKKSKNIIYLLSLLVVIVFFTAGIKQTLVNSKGEHNTLLFETPLMSSADPKVHINGNWSLTVSTYSWCTGAGTYSDPYVIQDLTIDDEGGPGIGILIENTIEYFIIENCTIQSLHAGIRFNSVSNGTILNCTAKMNDQNIYLFRSQNNSIFDTIVMNNRGTPGSNGLLIEESTYTQIINNTCNYSKSSGIYLLKSSFNNISNNICYLNQQKGIHLYNGSNYNIIYNNTCTFNIDGIHLQDNCSYNTLVKNSCKDNDVMGIWIYSADNTNWITENNCSFNEEDGINIDHGSVSQILLNNYCSENTFDGITIQSSSWNNTIEKNKCVNTGCGLKLNLDTHHNIIKTNLLIGGGIKLYWGGHNNTIIGNNCSFILGPGILIEGITNNTIKNNICNNNSAEGIVIQNSIKNNIINNTCNGNGRKGINLDSGYNNTLNENICSFNVESGIQIQDINDTVITGNICYNNTEAGIRALNGNYNRIENNNCTGNYQGIDVSGNFTYINKNICIKHQENAITLRNSINSSISYNNCSEFNIGIQIENCNDTSIMSNLLERDTGQTILIGASLRIDVNRNNLSGNGINTIWLVNTNYTTLLSNNCSEIRIEGGSNRNLITQNWARIAIENSNNNSVSYNNCSFTNLNGIEIRNSDFNKVWGNNCTENNEYGIFLDSNSDNNEIFENTLIENVKGCIKDDGSNNDIHDNYCRLPTPLITTLSQTIYTNVLLIQWTSVIPADNYSLYVNGVFNVSSGNSEETVIFGGNGTYVITVKAINQYAESLESNSITIIVEIPPLEVPPPPTITTSSQTIITDRLVIQWTVVSSVDYYNVYVNGIFNVSSIDAEEQVIFWVNGTYDITVTAVNASGESAYSTPITITVEIPPTPPDVPDPPIITTLNHTIIVNRVLIKWTSVLNTDYYNIYINNIYNTSVTTLKKWITFGGNGTYDITVTAVNALGESIASNVLEIIVKLYPDYIQWFKTIHVNNNWSETVITYEWCSGSGTYEDPFVIQDAIINTGGVGMGILIENTIEYFLIKDCIILNYGINDSGVKLSYVNNGMIENIQCNGGGENGIFLLSTNNATIRDNICKNNENGIQFESSFNCTLSLNNFSTNTNGIFLFVSSNNSIVSNNCSFNLLHGVLLVHSHYNNITYNTCSFNTLSGIALDANNNKVYGNFLLENMGGCIEDNGVNNDIHDNICRLPTPAILTSSQTVTVDRLLIQWTPVNIADNYTVYLDGVFYATTNETQLEVIFIGEGTYGITVKSRNLVGESDFSNVITITVDLPPTNPPEAPVITTPSQTIDTDRITIQWSTVPDSDNYTIYLDGVSYGTTSATQLEVIFSGDGTYSITVTATNVVGESEQSDAVEIIVDTTPTPPPDGGGIPGFELESLSAIILVSIIVSGMLTYRRKKKIKL